MARTPKKLTTGHSFRRTRSAAPVRFSNGVEGNISGDDYEDQGAAMQDHKNRQTKETLARSSAFQAEKKSMYAAARKDAREIARFGTAYIEEARARIQEMRTQEASYEKDFKEFERMRDIQEKSISSWFSAHSGLLEDLALRRSAQVNTASEMVESNPTRRQIALKKFSKNARARVEEVRTNEKVATDASALIKHYKDLLYA